MGDGAGSGRVILYAIGAVIVAIFCWFIYRSAVATFDAVNSLLDWFADQIIITSPLLALIAVVYSISMWAKRSSYVAQVQNAAPLAIRDRRGAKSNPVRDRLSIPDGRGLHTVPPVRVMTER